MTRSALVQLFTACGVVAALCPSLILLAEEPQASQLLPGTTVAYLEIPDPAAIMKAQSISQGPWQRRPEEFWDF